MLTILFVLLTNVNITNIDTHVISLPTAPHVADKKCCLQEEAHSVATNNGPDSAFVIPMFLSSCACPLLHTASNIFEQFCTIPLPLLHHSLSSTYQ
jgi:hypothetical protein